MASHSGLSRWLSIALHHIGLVFLLSCGIGGCSLFKQSPAYEELLALTLASRSASVRPGEAVVVEAQLKNVSDATLAVKQLNADSLSFYWWSDNNPNRLRRHFVFSPKEDIAIMADLPEGKVISRPFLFTIITQQQGIYYLQAIYKTPVKGKRESPMVVSLPLKYEVGGEPLFKRGDDGLILKQDAIRVAKEYLGRPTVSESAALIENEAGFYDWWVTVTVAEHALAKGERPHKGYFVNPYLGIVRKEAQPNL